jgi:hypothetical protein
MSFAEGPDPVKLRPCRPNVSHGTSDWGPPERSPVAGWTTPSSVMVSRTENALSARFDKPCNSTPVTRRYTRQAARIQPTAAAARGPIQCLRRPVSRR